MITANGLTKEYGRVRAVDDLSFSVRPGVVTGFLGPNGAGKSTALRLILHLDRADAGSATINGKPYQELDNPLRTVGALLDGNAFHPRRTARNHLRWLAAACGMPPARVEEVLGLVGLADAAEKKVGGYSLGMRQRLGIAAALIGDPEVLLLDEPVNGLDPEGIHWMRTLLNTLARQGRTVLVSSHLLGEMAQTAQDLVVIGKGRLIEQTTVADFIGHSALAVRVRVAPPDDGGGESEPQERARLAEALRQHDGARVEEVPAASGGPALTVSGISGAAVGRIALCAGVALAELSEQQGTLEEAFLEKTHEASDYRAQGGVQ